MIKHIATVATIENIFLRKSLFELLTDNVDEGSSLSISVNMEHEFLGEANNYSLECIYSTSVKGLSSGNEVIFTLEVDFKAIYSISEIFDWDDDEIEIFMGSCVNFHVWPFMREHVHAISSKANIPTVVLPLLPSGSKDN
jgi:preprotein translocase subunit SecB